MKLPIISMEYDPETQGGCLLIEVSSGELERYTNWFNLHKDNVKFREVGYQEVKLER